MAQIFCLAPSIKPPMLPVVSRQKTTSTWGFFLTGLSLTACPGDVKYKRAAAAVNSQQAWRNELVQRAMRHSSERGWDFGSCLYGCRRPRGGERLAEMEKSCA